MECGIFCALLGEFPTIFPVRYMFAYGLRGLVRSIYRFRVSLLEHFFLVFNKKNSTMANYFKNIIISGVVLFRVPPADHPASPTVLSLLVFQVVGGMEYPLFAPTGFRFVPSPQVRHPFTPLTFRFQATVPAP